MILFPDISPEVFSIDIVGFQFALRWYALPPKVWEEGAQKRLPRRASHSAHTLPKHSLLSSS